MATNKIQVPDLDDERVLRHVRFDGFRLLLWDTYDRCDTGQHLLGYAFWKEGEPAFIFAGTDYGCSPMEPIDSDDALRSLLGFLTLRPGDTDPDYFAAYTERQMRFAAEDAELLSMYAMKNDDDPKWDEYYQFTEIDPS